MIKWGSWNIDTVPMQIGCPAKRKLETKRPPNQNNNNNNDKSLIPFAIYLPSRSCGLESHPTIHHRYHSTPAPNRLPHCLKRWRHFLTLLSFREPGPFSCCFFSWSVRGSGEQWWLKQSLNGGTYKLGVYESAGITESSRTCASNNLVHTIKAK